MVWQFIENIFSSFKKCLNHPLVLTFSDEEISIMSLIGINVMGHLNVMNNTRLYSFNTDLQYILLNTL